MLTNFKLKQTVMDIMDTVVQKGDKALYEYAQKFDGVTLSSLQVDVEDLKEAYENTELELLDALRLAANNIEKFARIQVPQSDLIWESKNKKIILRTTPIERVGVYVPGGLAAYPSSVLMNVIPAKVAGVKEIALFTPPSNNLEQLKSIYAAAYLLNIKEVYLIGGAQAIAACTFGTRSVKKVDLISGPGNQYVTEAKRQVFGLVGIDMLAGPSELMVIADSTSNPFYVASDLLAQAEHDPQAVLSLILINTSFEKYRNAISDLLIIDNNSCASVSIDNLCVYECLTINEAAVLANEAAPEHLSIQVKLSDDEVKQFKNAGSVFVGSFTPEAIGDYASGSNHILPTSRTARFSSCLGVKTFMKQSQVIEYQQVDAKDYDASIVIATSERLDYHKKSLQIRSIVS